MTAASSSASSDRLVVDAARLGADEVAARLSSDLAAGLSDAEAARRLARFGPNALQAAPRPPWWRRVLAQLAEPLSILLLVAVAVSVLAWAVEGAHGAPIDAIVILAIVALNVALSILQETRAENAVAALSVMTRTHSRVVREGRPLVIASAEIVPGDVMLLAEGDEVGADGRVAQAYSLHIAEAMLTGESEPVQKDPRTLTADEAHALGDRTDMVYKGTAVNRGTGRVVVTATGMSTEVGAIAAMLEETAPEPTPLQREVDALGKVLARIVVVIAVVVMITISLVQGIRTPADLVQVLLLGVSLAVAAVPEGLAAVLSVVLALGVQRMATRQALVKRLSSVETLGSATVICTDKTGTLTTNRMTIRRIVTASGAAEVTGEGIAPVGKVLAGGAEVAGGQRREVQYALAAGALANDARLAHTEGRWDAVGDPTEVAFLVAARKLAGTTELVAEYERTDEVPFSSERKMMSTRHRTRGGGVLVCSKGAPDVLIGHCSRVQVGERVEVLDQSRRERALAEVAALSRDAYRTIAVAYRLGGAAREPATFDETDESDLVYVGVVGIIDPPRPEVPAAIARARGAGVRVIMITGDHPLTAARIARDLGIPGDVVLTGVDLQELSDPLLREALRATSVFARVAPEHKLRIVAALQADGHIVAMTGDGVNDAPALKAADIGVAMGISGTEVTKEAADMVLADDNFATIVAAIGEGRVIFDNIRKFLRYLLFSNMGEVLTVFLGIVFAGVLGFTSAGGDELLLPLLATQILWINLVTDSGPALAMGVDPAIDDVMARAPRGLRERTIDASMWAGVALTGAVIAVLTLLTMDIFLPGGLIPGGEDDFEVARTAGFSTLVFAALVTAVNARSATASAARGLFANPWLWASLGLGVVLQIAVVSLPPLQRAFGTVALDLRHWLLCVGMALVVLVVEEARKLAVRSWRRSRRTLAPGP